MTRTRVSLVVGLLILSTVSWRHGAYYEGGFDSVVATKAFLGFLALALAASKRKGVFRPSARSIVFLLLYLVVSLSGASQAGTFLPSFVLSVRVMLIAVTIHIVWSSVGTALVLDSIKRLSIGLALVAVATGLPGWSSAQRLSGGIPPITPNELAFFSAIGVICIFASIITRGMRAVDIALLIILLTIIWLTESRTSLAGTMLAMVVIALTTKRPSPAVVVIVCFLLPTVFYFVAFTNTLSSFLQRGGAENIGTFNNRTLAWTSAVNNAPDQWSALFGQGLSMKQVRVAAEYWDTQPLDSSWASAIVQAGWVGFALLTVWIIFTAIRMTRSISNVTALCVGLFVFLLSRSVLESGLFDATGAFMVFVVLSHSISESQDAGNDGNKIVDKKLSMRSGVTDISVQERLS